MGGERGGGDKGIEIFGVYFLEEQQAEEADKGQGEKRDGGDGTRGIEKRKFREDWGKRTGTFDALMWTVIGVWGGDLGMEGEGDDGKDTRETSKVVVGGKQDDTGIHD